MDSSESAPASLSGRRLLMVAHSNSAHTGRWARYFQQQGMTVRVVSPVADQIPGVDVLHFPGPKRWYHHLRGLHLYIDFPRWKRIFREFQPDITHVHYPDGGGRNRFYFNGIHPLVASTWGSEVVESKDFPLSDKHKAGVRAILQRCDVITATNPFLAGWTAKYCDPGTRIHVIPFGVDCDIFRPSDAPRSGLSIGFFKNLERKYGPDVLLEAFSLISAKYPDARLVMCGRGPMLDGLQRRAAELRLGDRVEFPGRLPHPEVVALMQSMDVSVMPSVCEESFGVAALEASACEVAVVASDVGGVRDVVVHEKTGLLVKGGDVRALADACIALLADNSKRVEMGQAGRRFVLEHYQWRENAAIMASVYAQIIARAEVKTPNMVLA